MGDKPPAATSSARRFDGMRTQSSVGGQPVRVDRGVPLVFGAGDEPLSTKAGAVVDFTPATA